MPRCKLINQFAALKKAIITSARIMGVRFVLVDIIGVGFALLPSATAIMLGKFTDSLSSLATAGGSINKSIILLLLLTFTYLINSLYTILLRRCTNLHLHKAQKYIKKMLIECASSVQYEYIDNNLDFRNNMLFAEKEGGMRVAESFHLLLTIIQYLVSLSSIMFLFSKINIWLVLLVFITCIPSAIISQFQKTEEFKEKTKNMTESAMSVHLFYICTGANEKCRSLLDMRFGMIFQWLKKKWKGVSEDYINKKSSVTRKYLFWNILADFLRNSFFIFVLFQTSFHIFKKPSNGIGLYMLVFSLSTQMQIVTTKLLSGINKLATDINYMDSFFLLLKTPKEQNIVFGFDEAQSFKNASSDIKFNNVCFSYPGSYRNVINSLSLSIKEGERIAIVGDNGSGKTTFVNLLCGFYKPTSGDITIGSTDIHSNIREIRNLMSVVFQNFGRYETTIRNNILISDMTRCANITDIEEASRLSGALSYIKSLPNQYYEEIGSFSNNGSNMSGGEWQKIALARALYRKNAKILILDEPTAALDPVAEASIYNEISKLTMGKTTILISHRLGICKLVDRVIVFSDGQVVEDGKHEELLATGQMYAKMFKAQSIWYENKSSCLLNK